MKETGLESVFEKCLQRLAQGEPLDAILKDYPAEASRLRPLLETSAVLQQMKPAPASAQTRNAARASFLAAAGDQRRKPARRMISLGWRHAMVTAVILLVTLGALLGTGFTSALALPGDTLYTVKRAVEQTRLALSGSTLDQLKLEETFDERRVEEAASLVKVQRSETVAFYGILDPITGGGWKVGKLVIYPKDPKADWSAFSGAEVEVIGRTSSRGIEADAVRLRTFHLEGLIEKTSPVEWVVSGTAVEITPDTQVDGTPKIGARVSIEAIQKHGRKFAALVIGIGKNAENIPTDEESISLKDWTTLATQQPYNEDENKSGGDGSGGATVPPANGEHPQATPLPNQGDESGHQSNNSTEAVVSPTSGMEPTHLVATSTPD